MNEILLFCRKHKIFCSLFFIFIFLVGFLGFYLKDVTAEESFTCPTVDVVKESEKVTETEFMVDIKGAVVSPGVYKVTNKMIVNDVITLAGGLLESADTSNLNLSKQLTKEMVITVFTKEEIKEEKIQKKAVNETNSEVTTKDDKIHLNTATLEELMTLPNIGEAKAKLILDYRSTCGPFKSLEELKNIKGIGESVYEKLVPDLAL